MSVILYNNGREKFLRYFDTQNQPNQWEKCLCDIAAGIEYYNSISLIFYVHWCNTYYIC